MKNGLTANRRFAPLWLLAFAVLAGASCVKLPRHASLLSSQAAPQASRPETASTTLVNLNTASADELEKLPGIGRALAARIVAHRSEQGRFRRAEHLMMVRGISERRFRAMRAMISVE